MRGILGVALSACLLVGCGGVGVEEAQDKQEMAALLPPCIDSCVKSYQDCSRNPPPPPASCYAQYDECLTACYAVKGPVGD